MMFGKGKWAVLPVVFLFVPVIISGQTGNYHTYHFEEKLKSASTVSDQHDIIINYSLAKLDLQGLTQKEGNFYRISAPGHSSSSVPGRPELPVFSRLITIPEGAAVVVKISDVKSQKIRPSRSHFKGLLYPSQVSETKTQEKQKAPFIIDRALYSKKGFIETDTVRIEYLGRIRGKQLANIYITPLTYNPSANILEVITSMKVEVSFTGASAKSGTSGLKESPLFTESMGKGTLNYDASDLITGYSDRPAGIIILTDTAFRKHLQPYITWKTRKGFRVTTIYKGAGLAGSTFDEIKNTIRNIYNSSAGENPDPEYLLIVGDVNKIPSSSGTSEITDLYYGEFDGNGDYLPEMYIGRLPAADTNELKSVVSKIVQYESFQFSKTNTFYKGAIVTAGEDASKPVYMNGQVKYASSYYLNQTNKVDGHFFYYPEAAGAEDTIKKLINKGVSFINYTGHGVVSGWVDPSISVMDIQNFTNKNMYPFVITNACWTARYNNASSFGNKMVVASEKGSIGYIGCSGESFWDEDYYWAVGVGTISADPKYSDNGLGSYDRLFHTNGESPSDWYITMGQVNFAGNMAVSASSSTKKKYYWETYTLLGDPSIIPYIGTPDTFQVTLPDTLPNGIRSFSLTIDPFAYIAVSHWDTLWDASYTSPSGSVVLDMPGLSNDSCLVIISGQNKVPLIKTIYFSDIDNEFINLSATAINDEGSNNNGAADFGETFYLKTTISNLGLAEATGLYGKLSTTSDLITIINDSVNIGSLAAMSEIVLANHFEITVEQLIPDKVYATLNLMLKDTKTEKNYMIDICLHAPRLEILSCKIDDTGTGNGDLVADPGETVNLVFSVLNTGTSNISGYLKITNNPPQVTINQLSVPTGSLTLNEIKSIPVSITLSPLMAKGSLFTINSMLDCNPYTVNKTYSIPVGKIRESFEYQSFTMFPWQNMSEKPWIISGTQSYDGQFSARSALFPVSTHNVESSLKISVNVPVKDTVKFMYKVSSEPQWDYLAFKLNGVQLLKVTGEAGWSEKKVELKEGFNLLEWIYKKDETVSSGSDCAMIDYITFPSLGFCRIDLKTGEIITPQPGKDYAQETITSEIINFGTDTIYDFNLAYKINEAIPVTEHFIKKIFPADTIVVAFTTPADLGGAGPYLVKVYGFNNNDGYLKNDTTSMKVYNTAITPVEKPDNILRVMPNPFSESLRIDLTSQSSDELRISVFEPAGRLLWENSFSVIPGENILTITPGSLPSGFYTLRVKGKTMDKVARIIKR